MKVGDLVKVYNFTYKARERFPDDDSFMLGLIAPGDTTMYRNWYVRLCKHSITEIYQEDRLEIINESR